VFLIALAAFAGAALAPGVSQGVSKPGAASKPPYYTVDADGVKCDGVTDDSAAMQAHINRVLGPEAWYLRGGRSMLCEGVIRITKTLVVNQAGGIMEGQGWGGNQSLGAAGTTFRWDGPPGVPMLRIEASQGFTLRGVRFLGNPAARPSAAVEVIYRTTDAISTNFVQLEYVSIGAGLGGESSEIGFAKGILLSGANANNDSNMLSRVVVRGVEDAGVEVAQSNFVREHLSNVFVFDAGVGFRSNGNLDCDSCGTIGSRSVDLEVGPNGRISIDGFYSELGRQLAKLNEGSLSLSDGYWCRSQNAVPVSDGVIYASYSPSYRNFIRLEDVNFYEKCGAFGAETITGTMPSASVILSNTQGISL
jgi:hypothetical protein